MLTVLPRSAAVAARGLQRPVAGFATAAPRIGDTKVYMSPLEKSYINYQLIEDNLAIVRQRSANYRDIYRETDVFEDWADH